MLEPRRGVPVKGDLDQLVDQLHQVTHQEVAIGLAGVGAHLARPQHAGEDAAEAGVGIDAAAGGRRAGAAPAEADVVVDQETDGVYGVGDVADVGVVVRLLDDKLHHPDLSIQGTCASMECSSIHTANKQDNIKQHCHFLLSKSVFYP